MWKDYSPQLYCVCGHVYKKHEKSNEKAQTFLHATHWCGDCSRREPYVPGKMFHNFELDNLSYIEDLAVKRGLI